MYQTNNADNLDQFQRYVTVQKAILQKNYGQLLAQDLSTQQWDGCFERNVLASLKQFYVDALLQLQALSFDSSDTRIEKGLVSLTKQVLVIFDGFVDEFLLYVVDKHRTSCALSNFPDEHKPDKVYVNEVRRNVAELWQNFALDVNDYFLQVCCQLETAEQA